MLSPRRARSPKYVETKDDRTYVGKMKTWRPSFRDDPSSSTVGGGEGVGSEGEGAVACAAGASVVGAGVVCVSGDGSVCAAASAGTRRDATAQGTPRFQTRRRMRSRALFVCVFIASPLRPSKHPNS